MCLESAILRLCERCVYQKVSKTRPLVIKNMFRMLVSLVKSISTDHKHIHINYENVKILILLDPLLSLKIDENSRVEFQNAVK